MKIILSIVSFIIGMFITIRWCMCGNPDNAYKYFAGVVFIGIINALTSIL